MPGQRVAHLVAHDRTHLLLVQQLHQPGGQHDDRLVQADAHGVGLRILLDEHLRDLRQVQHGAGVQQHRVQVRELLLAHPHRIREEQQPQAALGQQAAQRLEDRVEPAQLAQRHQGRAVRRMLVRTGGDAREAPALPARHVLVTVGVGITHRDPLRAGIRPVPRL
ncbi:hypothetical protein GCM10020000_54930 [Streptomyces olivoverticillatus]